MKWTVRSLAILLLAGLAMRADAGQSSDRPGPSTSPDQGSQQTQRPTLGPKAGPGVEAGPTTATVIDIRRLMRIRTIYIENIDNDLSDRLVEALGKWGRFRLVTKEKEADATVRGTCLESRHLKHLHSEIFISDHAGKSVWQDIIYRPYNPPSLEQAVDDTARLVATHLEATIARAERQ